jgi:hypothetical protein
MEVRDSSTLTMSGGAIGNQLKAYDDSTITLSGGTVIAHWEVLNSSTGRMSDGYVGWNLYVENSSTFTMIGGTVDDELFVGGSSSFTMRGGDIGGQLLASNTAIITIVGHGFEVNDSPVLYGEIAALFGRLTGTLASDEPIDNIFYQGGGSYTGTIRLVPEPSTALLLTLGLVMLTAGRQRTPKGLG